MSYCISCPYKNINMGIWYNIKTNEIGILTLEQGLLWFHVGDFDYHFTLKDTILTYIGEL